MKSIRTFIRLLSIVLVMAGCTNEKPNEIAILKYVTHPALDELEDAYELRLNSLIKSHSELKNFKIKKYNANGNIPTAKSIAESFNYKNVKLILTIATPAAIAVANTSSDVPHIYGAVADPQGAKIIPSNRSTGIQNAGENIIIDALSFMRKAFPDAKRIGTIYNPDEQNSIFVQNHIKSNAPKFGFEVKQATVSGTSQFAGVTEHLCKDVDLVYSANDNTVNSGISSIISVCNKLNKPFIIGDLSTLDKGALFAVGLKYSTMGNDLAFISYEILRGKKISDFPPQGPPSPEIWMNASAKQLLNYT